MKINDIHFVAAFFEDIGAVIVLCDAADVENLAQFFVIEQFYLVEQVDTRQHLIDLDLGVGARHSCHDIVRFLNRNRHFNSHTFKRIKYAVDHGLVGIIFVVYHPSIAIAFKLYLVSTFIGEKQSSDRGGIINSEIVSVVA